MTRYRCASCDETFELSDGERPRCPGCLRQHGLEELTPAGAAPRRPPALRRHLVKLLVGLFALGLCAAVAWLLVRRQTDLPQKGALGVLDEALLRRTLESRGVTAADQLNPFSSNAALRALAGNKDQRAGGDPRKRAQAVAARVAQAIQPVQLDLTGRIDAPARDPAALLTALKGNKFHGASSLELALLLTATLRQAGLQALLCQLHELDAPVRSADVVGGLGRYAACVLGAKGPGSKPVVVLDPARALALPAWAGGGGDPKMTARTMGTPKALDDASAAAHLLAQRALRLRNRKPDQAYRLSATATAAASPSATLQMVRARVLAAAGGTTDARTAADKALSLRDGAATRTTLAQVLLAAGDAFGAVKHLERALKHDRAYWPAHQTLAAVTFSADPKRGAKHLEAGLAVAPEEPSLLLLKATQLLSDGEADQAVTLLRKVSARAPSEFSHLMLYQALQRAGDEQEAAKVRQHLEKTASDRKKIKQLLDAVDQSLKERAGQPAHEQPDEPATSGAPPPPSTPPRLTLPDVKLGQ
jgi:tetratricopeptide (TPR) repeat protein